jgi:hypothetical protein
VFIPPFAVGAALRQENTGARFRDVAGLFLPGTARNVRRNLPACAEDPDSAMWRNVPVKE